MKKLLKLAEKINSKDPSATPLFLFDEINSLSSELEKLNTKLDSLKQEMPDLRKIFAAVKGEQGIQGVKGDKGDKGEQGEKGERGERGEQGIPGKDGKSGKDGLKGKDGRDGKDGLNGKDGKNGKNGIDGVDGKDGRDGKDGTTSIVRVGGAAFAWKHEIFNINSSTTTITLASPVGAGGLAIFASYNGQAMSRGTHYTMNIANPKVLTLAFTPEDGTTFEVAYMLTKRTL